MRRRVHRPTDHAARPAHGDGTPADHDVPDPGSAAASERAVTPALAEMFGASPTTWRHLSFADVAVREPERDPLHLDDVTASSPAEAEAAEVALDGYRERLRRRLQVLGDPVEHEIDLPRIDGRDVLADVDALRGGDGATHGSPVEPDSTEAATAPEPAMPSNRRAVPDVIDLREGSPATTRPVADLPRRLEAVERTAAAGPMTIDDHDDHHLAPGGRPLPRRPYPRVSSLL